MAYTQLGTMSSTASSSRCHEPSLAGSSIISANRWWAAWIQLILYEYCLYVWVEEANPQYCLYLWVLKMSMFVATVLRRKRNGKARDAHPTHLQNWLLLINRLSVTITIRAVVVVIDRSVNQSHKNNRHVGDVNKSVAREQHLSHTRTSMTVSPITHPYIHVHI